MFLISQTISWLVPILTFLLFELTIKNPKTIVWTVAVSLLVMFFSLVQMTGQKLSSKKFWRFIISPEIFLASSWFFLSFLDGDSLRHAVAIVSSLTLWLLLKIKFLFFNNRPRYQAHALENISSYINLVSVFFTFSSLYALSIFFDFEILSLSVIALVVIVLLTYQLFWASDLPITVTWLAVFVISLVMVEIFVAVSYLPTSIYVGGMILSVCYYLSTGITRNWLLDIKEKRVIRRYLLNSIFLFIIVLLTAKWI